jgi:hypothetical protein
MEYKWIFIVKAYSVSNKYLLKDTIKGTNNDSRYAVRPRDARSFQQRTGDSNRTVPLGVSLRVINKTFECVQTCTSNSGN